MAKRCDECQEFYCDSCPYDKSKKERRTSMHDELKKELAKWIDVGVLAEGIVETLEENTEPEEMTLEIAKKLWLNFLETEFRDGLDRSLRYGQF